MLERHRDHAREVVTGPRPLEVVAGFAHPARGVPQPVEESRLVRRRLGREAEGGVQLEVVGLDDHRVAQVGPVVVAARQQDDGAQVHRLAPPLAQDTAADLHSPDPLGVRRHVDGRQDIDERQADRRLRARVDAHAPRLADEVAGRERPALALPLVLGSPEDVAVPAAILRVDVDQGLHPVVARRQLPELRVGIADRPGVDDHGLARGDAGHVGREEGHAAVALPGRAVGGDPRLGFRGGAEGQEEPPGQRPVVQVGRVADLEAEAGRRSVLRRGVSRRSQRGGHGEERGRREPEREGQACSHRTASRRLGAIVRRPALRRPVPPTAAQ